MLLVDNGHVYGIGSQGNVRIKARAARAPHCLTGTSACMRTLLDCSCTIRAAEPELTCWLIVIGSARKRRVHVCPWSSSARSPPLAPHTHGRRPLASSIGGTPRDLSPVVWRRACARARTWCCGVAYTLTLMHPVSNRRARATCGELCSCMHDRRVGSFVTSHHKSKTKVSVPNLWKTGRAKFSYHASCMG
jgi:hypothetical protein